MTNKTGYPIDCETCGEQIDDFDEDMNGMCPQCYDTPPNEKTANEGD